MLTGVLHQRVHHRNSGNHLLGLSTCLEELRILLLRRGRLLLELLLKQLVRRLHLSIELLLRRCHLLLRRCRLLLRCSCPLLRRSRLLLLAL